MVKFELRPHISPEKRKNGDVEYVSIVTGVDTVHRPATDDDRRMYAAACNDFKAGLAPTVLADPPVPPVFLEKRVNPKGKEVDYISIASGVDRVHREVTDADKANGNYEKLFPKPVEAVAHVDSPEEVPAEPALDETQKSEVPSLIARTLKSLGVKEAEPIGPDDQTPVDNPKKRKK